MRFVPRIIHRATQPLRRVYPDDSDCGEDGAGRKPLLRRQGSNGQRLLPRLFSESKRRNERIKYGNGTKENTTEKALDSVGHKSGAQRNVQSNE